MRLPRYQLRTLLILVAILAVAIGTATEVSRRRDRYLRLAEQHRRATEMEIDPTTSPADQEAMMRRSDRHARLAERYLQASNRPWMVVAPDPVGPE
jgi:hypothetical protein